MKSFEDTLKTASAEDLVELRRNINTELLLRTMPKLHVADHHREYFIAVVELAKKIGMYDKKNGNHSLEWNLEYLANYGGEGAQNLCELYPDRPNGFGFLLKRRTESGEYRTLFNGGLLYHGAIDGFGSGAFPVAAVTLTPTDGWSIHT